MSERTMQENGIIQGVIWKQLLIFFFPILFGTFFQQLYNTADTVIVGRFVGANALAAVGGSAAVLITLLISLFTGIASGSTVMVSQYYGAGKFQDVGKAVHTSVLLAIVAGGGMMILGLIFAPWALRATGTPEEIFGDTLLYLRIYLLGSIPSFLYNVGSAVLRAVGDNKRPLLFLIIACMVNIVLDLVLVVWLHLAVLGVAIATVLSQVVSAVLVIVALQNTDFFPSLSVSQLRFTPNILQGILLIGVPAGLQSDMYSIANIIMQATINTFGTSTIAAWSAYIKVENFFFMVMSAFGIAITTFVGQNFGAGKVDRVKKSVWICLAMSMATTAIISLLFHFFGRGLLSMFTTESDVLEIGLHMLSLISPFYFCYVCIEIMSGAIRGTGEAFPPMMITCCGICVLRIVWIFAVIPFYHSMDMVAISYPISWGITSLIFIVYYLRGKWLKKQMHIMGIETKNAN